MNTKKFLKQEIKGLKSSIKWYEEYINKMKKKLGKLEEMLRE